MKKALCKCISHYMSDEDDIIDGRVGSDKNDYALSNYFILHL